MTASTATAPNRFSDLDGATYTPAGLTIPRRHTVAGEDPFASFTFVLRRAEIKKMDGSIVFEQDDVEVPDTFSQTTVNVLADKYLRKTGVPQHPLTAAGTYDLTEVLVDEDGQVVTGPERSARQTMMRLANAWAIGAARHGYLASADDALALRDELAYLLMAQYLAPNSPQWFNTGLHTEYGIEGGVARHFYWNPAKGAVVSSPYRYHKWAANACFILGVEDTLNGEDGVADFIAAEMALFKDGSGSGANLSKLRAAGEPLSSGGRTSGALSWAKIADTNAGAVKSGGTTRRAAKMVIFDVDHPDVEEFIWVKAKEEEKAKALIAAGYESRYDGDAYATVAFQNGNNSVRLDEGFMDALTADGDYELTRRVDGGVAKTVKARDIWRQIAEAAWQCADPGVQYSGIINDWHTAKNWGPIRGSNPCSEYLFLDNTACNLASMNLTRFFDDEAGTYDVDSYLHAVRLLTLVLEVTVAESHYPTEKVAALSYQTRTLGLGYCNLGSLLMRNAIAYDSEEGRAVAAALTSLMTSHAYATSAEIAAAVGACEAWEPNAEPMTQVLNNHRLAARGTRADAAERFAGLAVTPQVLDHDALARTPFAALSDRVLERADAMLDGTGIAGPGYRNMQVTVLAPTGTISFIMDADTTGVEPAFSLVAFKKLAGGGDMVITNNSVWPALKRLGYSDEQARDISSYIVDNFTIEGAPHLRDEHLPIFDCAVEGGSGVRSIVPAGHIRMLGATAPFLSGAASKTVNLPESASVTDIEDIHQLAYDLGVKCVAIYRNNSKGSQPLNTKADEEKAEAEAVETVARHVPAPGESPTAFYGGEQVPKFRLPNRRAGLTFKADVGGTELLLRTGEYPDGTLGEIFIDLSKEGSTLKGVLSCFSIAVSKGLQRGVPLSEYVDTFCFHTFEPRGIVVGDDNVKMANSIMDYVFRKLAYEYLGREDLVQRPYDAKPVTPSVAMAGGASPDRVEQVTLDVSPEPDTAPAEPVAVKTPAQPTGAVCGECDGMLVPNGGCLKCTQCGATTGCS